MRAKKLPLGARQALAKAERKKKPYAAVTVYQSRYMLRLLDAGWEVVSYTPTSYGAPQTWKMIKRLEPYWAADKGNLTWVQI